MLCVEFGPKINLSNHPVAFAVVFRRLATARPWRSLSTRTDGVRSQYAVVREELVKTITKTVNEASRSFDLRCAAGYFDVNY